MYIKNDENTISSPEWYTITQVYRIQAQEGTNRANLKDWYTHQCTHIY